MAKTNAAAQPNVTKTTKTRAPRTPSPYPPLFWNDVRDRRLVEQVAKGVNHVPTIAANLRTLPEFAGIGAGVSDAKVRRRIGMLRKDGVNIPSFGRGERYKANTDALNALLQTGE